MINCQALLRVSVHDLVHPVKRCDQARYPGDIGRVAHIDMGGLMVGDGERPRCPRVQVFPALLGVDIQIPFPPELTVDIHRALSRCDPVLGDDDGRHVVLGDRRQQGRQRRVDVGGGGDCLR
ncbi:hypothetical protein A4G31_26895 [Mycobacterium persicum]|nr:hypothetical protein A4G31_26895 [Mycobacterium persicum]